MVIFSQFADVIVPIFPVQNPSEQVTNAEEVEIGVHPLKTD